jgi:protein ImuB
MNGALADSTPRGGAHDAAPAAPAAGAGSRPRAVWLAAHLPELRARAPQESSAQLAVIAAAALELTPLVSPEPPADLLLEVGGSLKLFGGLAAIRTALAEKIARQGLRFHLCAAPTPRAALWLARAAQADALDGDRLADRLAPLPLPVTGWPAGILELLGDMGVRTVGDCLRLPRDGFARRIGRDCLLELDRALGRADQPRDAFSLPGKLGFQFDLPSESIVLDSIVAAVDVLLERLVAALRERQAQIAEFELLAHHERHPPTGSAWRLVEPADELARLKTLIRDRLERIAWPAPVVRLSLATGELRLKQFRAASLFVDDPNAVDPTVAARCLLERLAASCGAGGVHGLAFAADHRPERASRQVGQDALAGAAPPLPERAPARDRPLWMLHVPRPLREAERRLMFLSGPERIAGGWWDGADVNRDYYVVRTTRGDRLWIYRDRAAPRQWYLHGLFG